MDRIPRRGLAWRVTRLKFWVFKLVGWLFSVLITHFVLVASLPALLLVDSAAVRQLLAPWYGFYPSPFYPPPGYPGVLFFLELYADYVAYDLRSGITWNRLAMSAAVYVLFSAARFAYLRWRYGFARDLLLIRTLIIFDPQMAIVRQRLVLENAIARLAEPMVDRGGFNLHNALRALTMLNKLPDHVAKLAHAVRTRGNTAAHPREDDEKLLMEPGNALAIALSNQSTLQKVLAWCRSNEDRSTMTREEWERIQHQFTGDGARAGNDSR